MNSNSQLLSLGLQQAAALRQQSYASALGAAQLGGLAGTSGGFFTRSYELSTEDRMQMDLDMWLIDWDKTVQKVSE